MSEEISKIYMDATLQPSRSLSNQGINTTILTLLVLSVVTSLPFLGSGFSLIMFFISLHLFVLWLAFRINNKSLSQKTFVRVTAENLSVRHIDPKGKETKAKLPTAFTQVSLNASAEENTYIKLSSAGKSYAIGKFLTPDERLAFVASLKNAIHTARAERYAAIDPLR